MKFVAALAGAIASGVICFIIFSLISQYQIAQVGYVPNQSDKLIDIFMVVAPLLILAGGWLSLRIYKKHLRKSSSRR
jgi:hypothetical protein